MMCLRTRNRVSLCTTEHSALTRYLTGGPFTFLQFNASSNFSGRKNLFLIWSIAISTHFYLFSSFSIFSSVIFRKHSGGTAALTHHVFFKNVLNTPGESLSDTLTLSQPPVPSLLNSVGVLLLNSENSFLLIKRYSDTTGFCLARSSFHFTQTIRAQGTGKINSLVNSETNLSTFQSTTESCSLNSQVFFKVSLL